MAGYAMEVGFIDEPVFVGDKSGLEFSVMKDDQPVEGLEQTLTAQVTYGGRAIYRSSTRGRAGLVPVGVHSHGRRPYTFHITGSFEGTPIDESFTSSPTGFDEVQEARGPMAQRAARRCPSCR